MSDRGKNAAPIPPDDLRKQERHRRMRKNRGAGALARFFTKQVLWFIALVFVLLVVDVFLYILIAAHEMDRSYLYGTPATLTRETSEQLALVDGTYALSGDAAAQLDEQGAWAQLIAPDGTVPWSHNVPLSDHEPATVTAEDAGNPDWTTVPSAYTVNQVALIAHYHRLNAYPAFIWDRDDGLLLVGFPQGSYETMTITWPKETWRSLPEYIMGVLILDLLILFAAYVVYRRRTQRAVQPITEALGALSRGGRAQLDLKGDLQPIADQINETSDVLERKDQAREQWIRGVSHDIRTPLSMIIVKSEAIAARPDAEDALRSEARAIRTQGMKIKDLVADLNTASQLSFSSQPLNLARVHVPKLVRGVAASYLNSGFDDSHPLDLALDDGCADAVILGDERMLTRLLENLLSNARLHNPDGCRIRIELGSCETAEGRCVELSVVDDGKGVHSEALAALEARLAHARVAPDEAAPDDAGHGLGLVLVDRIARAHGGSFHASGTPGGGFAARILLPLA